MLVHRYVDAGDTRHLFLHHSAREKARKYIRKTSRDQSAIQALRAAIQALRAAIQALRAAIQALRANFQRVAATRLIGSLREQKSHRHDSALALLMPGVRRTDDVHDAAAPHDFAVLTNLLHRRTNFHFLLPMPRRLAFFIRPSY